MTSFGSAAGGRRSRRRFVAATATVVAAMCLLPGVAFATDQLAPTAIGVSGDGVSYVGYPGSGQIFEIDGSGNVSTNPWGVYGDSLGQIDGVVGISVDPTGNVWVLDTNLHVEEFTASGTFERGWSLPACAAGDSPNVYRYGGIAATANAVYVAHPCDTTVLRYSRTGSQVATRTLPGRPRGLAVGAAGAATSQIFIALPDQQEVLTYETASFAQTSSEPPLKINGTPEGVTDRASGDELIVSDVANDDLYVYNPGQLTNGQYTLRSTLGHGSSSSATDYLNAPVAIAQDPVAGSQYDSNLFIAENGDERVQRWTDTGSAYWATHIQGTWSSNNPGTLRATTPPSITGTAVADNMLACEPGTWVGNPSTFEFQWLRNGVAVDSGQNYLVQSADAGQQLSCQVLARNASGPSASEPTSAAVTASDAASPPDPLDQPTITGLAQPGGPLACNTAGWAGSPQPTYSYTWSRNGTPIYTGGSQYTVVAADVGQAITCSQAATNASGSASVTSPAVTPTAAPTPQVGVTIDNAAVYTNSPAVTLEIVPPSGTTGVTVSNDGGFDASHTFAVASSGQYAWTLQTSGADRLPKTVYVRFTAPGIPAYETLTDGIILDQTDPTIQSAALAAPGAPTMNVLGQFAVLRHLRRSGMVLRVRAHDTISGVASLQYAPTRSARRAVTVRYARSIRIAHPALARWVRAIDRAGNRGRWHRVTR